MLSLPVGAQPVGEPDPVCVELILRVQTACQDLGAHGVLRQHEGRDSSRPLVHLSSFKMDAFLIGLGNPHARYKNENDHGAGRL